MNWYFTLDNSQVRVSQIEVASVSANITYLVPLGGESGLVSAGFIDKVEDKEQISFSADLSWAIGSDEGFIDVKSLLKADGSIIIKPNFNINYAHGGYQFLLFVEDNMYRSFCPGYSASHTNSALTNYAECPLMLCTDYKVEFFSLLDDYYSAANDPYIRLFDANGNEVAYNDDYYGIRAPYLSYSMHEYNSTECSNFYLRQGCYGSSACTVRETRMHVSLGSDQIFASPQWAETVYGAGTGQYSGTWDDW